MDDKMEEFERYTFHAKQDGGGEPFIAVVAVNAGLTVINSGSLAFTLPKGTSPEDATRLADYLDEAIENLAFVTNEDKPYIS